MCYTPFHIGLVILGIFVLLIYVVLPYFWFSWVWYICSSNSKAAVQNRSTGAYSEDPNPNTAYLVLDRNVFGTRKSCAMSFNQLQKIVADSGGTPELLAPEANKNAEAEGQLLFVAVNLSLESTQHASDSSHETGFVVVVLAVLQLELVHDFNVNIPNSGKTITIGCLKQLWQQVYKLWIVRLVQQANL